MQETFQQKDLDQISQQILLLLSSGQRLTFQEIARAIDQPRDITSGGISILVSRKYIGNEDNRYYMTQEGFEFLAERGFRPTKPTTPVKQVKSYIIPKLPLFGSWQDLALWFIFPAITSSILLTTTAILSSDLSLAHLRYLTVSAIIILLISGLVFLWRRTEQVGVPIILIVIGIISTSLLIKYLEEFYLRLILEGLAIVIIAWISILYWKKSYYSVPEYENIVVFRLGKCIGAKGPGPVIILPFLDRPQTVDLRVKHQEVPHEACITKDNVQIDVDFVFYWRIEQPVWSLTKVTDPEESIRLLATALLRAVIAHFPFDDVLNQRESINDLLREKIDEISSEWGVSVTTMEIREIKPPDEIVKSMHNKRAAEWQRQATVTEAEGQAEALKLLFTIASQIDNKTLNLKYFEMLSELGKGESTKYIFPLELTNMVQSLIKATDKENNGSGPAVDGTYQSNLLEKPK